MSWPANPKALIVAICALLASLLVCASPAQADEDPAVVTVTLTSVSPEALGNSGDLVITGEVTNTSDSELRRLEVRLWRDATPLSTLTELARATASTTSSGAVMESESARAQLTSGDAALAPGASAPFSVQASLAPEAAEQLWLSEPGAAYQVGVEVYGSEAGGGYRLLGRATTLAVYPDAEPINVATVVVLAARPSLLLVPAGADATEPIFADRSLAVELEGRLGELLSLAERPGTSTVIDPALYDEVTALAGPHQIRQADGSTAPGPASDSQRAAAWLARVDRLAAGPDLAIGLFGSPDVVAATAAGRPEVLAASQNALPRTHPLADLPLVVVPANHQIDSATLDALGQLDPWLVLAANLTPGAPTQTYNGLTALSVLTADLAEQRPDQQLAHRGWLQAVELLTANQGGVPVVVVDNASDAALAAAELAWRRPISVRELLVSHPGTEPLQLASVPEAESPTELVTATDRAIDLFTTFGELTDQAESAAAELDRALATSWSTSFAGDQAAQVHWLTVAGEPAAALLVPDAVQLRITDWVTTSAEDNQLPVTVNNNTTYPVHVQVHFESENPLRISVDDSELFVVEPGESTTVRVSPRTAGNGTTAITAQLVTVSGRPVAAPVDFVITGTAAGRVAWLIILASGAVLLVATSLRVRQVRRGKR